VSGELQHHVPGLDSHDDPWHWRRELSEGHDGYVESFGAHERDELLDVEQFSNLAEAQVVIADWRRDYNHRGPHSALGRRASVAFAAGDASDANAP
jgi:transposase InsO family protein